jgi:hypothetical protein
VGPPPHPVNAPEARIASRRNAPSDCRRWRSLRRFDPRSGRRSSAPTTFAMAIPDATRPACGFGPFPDRSSAAVVEVVSVLMVRVDVAVPETAGVTEASEKSQVEFLGRPLQLRLVALANPLTEVTVTVTVAGVPALKVPLDGESETERLGGPGQTVTATAVDVEAELFASPPYAAVTL